MAFGEIWAAIVKLQAGEMTEDEFRSYIALLAERDKQPA